MSYRTETALAEFEEWSSNYDRSVLQRLLFRPSHRSLLKHLNPGARQVLDVGCGTGVFAARVLETHPQAEVWGMDLSPKMLERSAQRLQAWPDRWHLIRGDSQKLPFEDNTFDAVTCSHSFHHYPRQQTVVDEMHRVLRPGGQLMIIDGYRDGPLGWFMFDVVVTGGRRAVHHCSGRRLRDLYKSSGFVEVQQVIHRLPIPFMLTIGQARKPAASHSMRLGKVA